MTVVAIEPRTLVRAWLTLLAFAAATSGLAAVVGPPPVPWLVALAVLALAWLKARVILVHYLGLAAAPTWRRGFEVVLALYLLLLFALFLLPALDLGAPA